MAKTKKTKDYIYKVGRRRTASARVRLYKGKGVNTVNTQPVEKYFFGPIDENEWSMPLKAVEGSDKFYFSAKVAGGGKKGQLSAVTHALAKSLAEEKNEFRKALKKLGLLTRDPRIRERRKVGMGGKARRKKQSPKR
jgi:Ribosomal protein S9